RNSVLSALKSMPAMPRATSSAPRGLSVPRGAVPLPAARQDASVVHVVLDPPVVGGQRGSSCGLTPLVAVVKIRRRILRSVDSPTVASVAVPMSEEKLYSPVTGTMQFVFPAAHA